MKENRIKLYLSAIKYIGKDASPADEAPDEFGCADSVSKILRNTFKGIIKGSVSTAELFNQLNTSPNFKRVKTYRAGDIIISPTGKGKTGKIPNGHVGIVAENDRIMSNMSATGTWEENYTVTSWVKRYRDQGGYPIYFFTVL
jgi:hypothetical protein